MCSGSLSCQQTAELHQTSLHAAMSLLDLITIILTQSKGEAIAGPILGVVSFYLSAIFTFLKSERRNSFAISYLLDSSLFAICAYQTFRNAEDEEEYSDEDIWTLAIHAGSPNVKTIAALSQYVVATGQLCGPLLFHEAWDYLLSTLTAIIEREVPEAEEPLSILLSPTLCYGLHSLFNLSSGSARNCALASPWTLSMKIALQVLLEGDVSTHSYLEILKQRIASGGEKLLKKMSTSEIQGPSLDACQIRPKLIYYRDDEYSGLLLCL